MKTEAKVGAFTLAGLLLLAALVIGLSGFSLRSGKGYTVYAGFHQVVGIKPENIVSASSPNGFPSGRNGSPVRTVQNPDSSGIFRGQTVADRTAFIRRSVFNQQQFIVGKIL